MGVHGASIRPYHAMGGVPRARAATTGGQLHPHGFEYELMKAYGDHLNGDLPKGQLKTHVVFVPVPFDRLKGKQ